MSEKKVVGRNVAIALGITCIVLAIGLVGAVMNYTSIISEKDNTIASLNSEIANFQEKIDDLNATYTWLKHHSFTYWIVGNDINISNVGIFENFIFIINGTATNIGTKPLKEVYVYAILVNPDGTKDFSPYRYDVINDLYMGETATFRITVWKYDESQKVELFLVY